MEPVNRLPAHAFLLAGGQSTRFGSDKARYLIWNQPLIVRLHGLLSRACQAVTVLTKQPSKYADLGLICAADRYPEQAPITGLLTALEMSSTEWCFVIACDLPNLSGEFLRELWEGRGGLGVIPLAEDRRQPLAALYHRDSLARFKGAYEQEEFALQKIVSAPGFTTMELSQPQVLANLNTPPDAGKG
ncbi:MAG: molybdenum cofactor guanylyltransferase [Candidatus Marinimicrobia bacterium]|nr:molybdenum cofactor guanylyltransferase [Candidatus Neomarinimicrobiota bacterium]